MARLLAAGAAGQSRVHRILHEAALWASAAGSIHTAAHVARPAENSYSVPRMGTLQGHNQACTGIPEAPWAADRP